jgi:hypothetical protein
MILYNFYKRFLIKLIKKELKIYHKVYEYKIRLKYILLNNKIYLLIYNF